MTPKPPRAATQPPVRSDRPGVARIFIEWSAVLAVVACAGLGILAIVVAGMAALAETEREGRLQTRPTAPHQLLMSNP